jgi:hypothetical protein
MKRRRGSERWQKIGQSRRQIARSQAMSGRRRRRNQREVVVVVDLEVEEDKKLGRGRPYCLWVGGSNKHLGSEAIRDYGD